jgi:hypothetical protein
MGKASRRKKLFDDVQVDLLDLSDFDLVAEYGRQRLLVRKETGLFYIQADDGDIRDVPGWSRIIGDKLGGIVFLAEVIDKSLN